eukprot:XP_015581725.1 uncharacterized protein LOC8269777 isoform X1 [Ricinus communis]
MSVSLHIADEFERRVSSLNSPSRVLIGNEVGRNEILIRIDMQAPLQIASAISPSRPDEEEGVTNEADISSGTIPIQFDGHVVLPGGLQTPTLQQNAAALPLDSPGTPPAPNDDQVQTQNPNGTPTGHALSNENAPSGEELTNFITHQEFAALNHMVREQEVEMLHRKMIESSLLIASQIFVTLLSAWLGNGNHPLSRNTKILRDFVVGSTILGYISSFSSILMCRLSTRLPARILNTIAYAGAAFGFIATMGMLLPDELKLWVTFLACTVCFPGLAAGFRA